MRTGRIGALTAVLAWLVVRTVYTSLEWAWAMQQRADQLAAAKEAPLAHVDAAHEERRRDGENAASERKARTSAFLRKVRARRSSNSIFFIRRTPIQ